MRKNRSGWPPCVNKAEGLPEVGRSSDSRVLTSARVAGSKQGRLLSEQTRAQAGMWPWKPAAMSGDAGSMAGSNSCLNAGTKCLVLF